MSLPNPQSRMESFLNAIAAGGDLSTLPAPQSRVEVYLDYIARNISQGDDIDLSAYATKEDLKTKADISHSHSNYANTSHTHDIYAEKQHTHDTYANKVNEHTHTNKTTIDGITDAKVTSWDNKADADHSHDDGPPSA